MERKRKERHGRPQAGWIQHVSVGMSMQRSATIRLKDLVAFSQRNIERQRNDTERTAKGKGLGERQRKEISKGREKTAKGQRQAEKQGWVSHSGLPYSMSNSGLHGQPLSEVL